MINTYYAYIHRKPNGIPFYVGKGTLRRANSLKQRNPYYLATVKKYGVDNIVVNSFECDSEGDAFELEMFLIECLKESGVKLTNCTDGGEGASGHVHSEEVRARISEIHKGKTVSVETREKLSKTGKNISLETRAKMSAVGRRRTYSAETLEKMSASNKGKPISAETLAKRIGRTHSAETRSKMSLAGKNRSVETREKRMGRMCSYETREKISSSLIKYYKESN